MAAIVQAVLGQIIWTSIFVSLFTYFMWATADFKTDRKGRTATARFLKSDRGYRLYRIILTKALNWLDRKLSLAEAHLPRGSIPRAFSHRLLEVTLTLAIAYPILALLVNWGIWNDGSISGMLVIGAEPDAIKRYAALIALIAGLVVTTLLFGLENPQRSDGLLVVVVIAVALALVMAGAGGIAFVVAFTIGMAGSTSVAVAIAVLVTMVSQSFVATVIAVAGGCALWSGFDFRKPTTMLFNFALLSIALIAFGLRSQMILSPAFSSENPRAMFLFLGFIPLLNGLTDFLSFGATRYFLRQGLAAKGFWRTTAFAFADVITAIVLFFLLVTSLILIIHHVRPQIGLPLLNLGDLFETLKNRETRGEYWWLLAMLFSVIVPTALHLALGIFLGLIAIPRYLAPALGGWLLGSATAIRNARGIMSFSAALSITLSFWLIVKIYLAKGYLLDLSIGFFVLVAEAIGAIPAGVEI